jgi:hypothetical protein
LIVATIGVAVKFTAVNDGIFPEPEAANPIPGVELVQLYCVPVPTKEIAVAVALLQSTTLAGAVTLGVGFTLITNEVVPPLQLTPPPENTEVTVTVEEIGAAVPLVAIKEAMLPLPEAAKPTAVFELVQVFEFPVPLKAIAALFDPLHKV